MFAVSKNNPHRGGILTCAHMLPPSSQRKSSQKRDFELGLCAFHHLKNNPPKGRIPKRWDKNPVQEILPEGRIINRVLLIEGYLHVSTFYSDLLSDSSNWIFSFLLLVGLCNICKNMLHGNIYNMSKAPNEQDILY